MRLTVIVTRRCDEEEHSDLRRGTLRLQSRRLWHESKLVSRSGRRFGRCAGSTLQPVWNLHARQYMRLRLQAARHLPTQWLDRLRICLQPAYRL
jgi:hypothetical protein